MHTYSHHINQRILCGIIFPVPFHPVPPIDQCKDITLFSKPYFHNKNGDFGVFSPVCRLPSILIFEAMFSLFFREFFVCAVANPRAWRSWPMAMG